MQKESSRDYGNVVSTRNAASGIDTIKGQHNKSYCSSDVAEQQQQKQTTLEKAFRHDDSM